MKRITFLLVIIFSTIIVTACGGTASSEPAPPVIHYGEDICEFCGMIISEERFAAGYITEDGQERIFDDVGGMFIAHLEKQEDVAAFFVHDYEDVRWIRAETAHYILSDDLPTPMLHGIAACETQEKADKLAAEYGGQVMAFDEVMTHFHENQTSMMPGEEMEHRHQ